MALRSLPSPIAPIWVSTLVGLVVMLTGSSGLAQPQLSASTVSRVEGQVGPTAFVFTVSMASTQPSDVAVSYATRDGHPLGASATAASGDYVATSGTVTIPAGSLSANFTVTVNGDSANESHEYFSVTFSNPVNALAPGTTWGRILNDDPLPTLHVDDAAIDEGDAGAASLAFPVRIEGLSGRTIRVDYATADGSAQAPGDYAATSGTLTIPPLAREATLTVPVHGDTDIEADETFTVALSSPQAAQLGDAQAVGTIVDDDSTVASIVTVVEPNGGELLYRGDPRFVHWASSRDPQARVRIELSLDGGATFDRLLVEDLEDTGWFLWDPIDVDTGTPAQSVALIRVTLTGPAGTGSDDSDDWFSIASAPSRTPTTIAIAPSGVAECGQPLTLDVTVSPAAAGIVELHHGGERVGSASLDAAGEARFSLPPPSSTQASFLALYRGDGSHRGSHGVLDLDLGGAPTTATLAMPETALCGHPLTLALEISPPTLAGTASFYEDGAPLGEVPVSGGSATFSRVPRSTGTHVYSATFAPEGCHRPSQAQGEVVVERGPTEVALGEVPGSASPSEVIVLVASTSPPAAGSVRFFSGHEEIGEAPLVEGGATLPVTLPPGEHRLTAYYAGDSCRLDGRSIERVLVVIPPDTLPPTLACPSAIEVPCGREGAIVSFTATATDDRDPAPIVTCVPASGTRFPVGSTVVTCTAVDSSGNQAQCTFVVTVRDADCDGIGPLRFQGLGLACSNGDTTVQYVEIVAAGPATFRHALTLRVYDRAGSVRLASDSLFRDHVDGAAWATGRRWLVATSAFAGAVLEPDRVAPLGLDLYGGRVTLEMPITGGVAILDEVVYGDGITPAPAPGHGLVRQSTETFVTGRRPLATRHDGAAAWVACPCPASQFANLCDTRSVSSPVASHSVSCGGDCHDPPCHPCNRASHAIDLRAGSIAASAVAEVTGNCQPGSHASTRTEDGLLDHRGGAGHPDHRDDRVPRPALLPPAVLGGERRAHLQRRDGFCG